MKFKIENCLFIVEADKNYTLHCDIVAYPNTNLNSIKSIEFSDHIIILTYLNNAIGKIYETNNLKFTKVVCIEAEFENKEDGDEWVKDETGLKTITNVIEDAQSKAKNVKVSLK